MTALWGGLATEQAAYVLHEQSPIEDVRDTPIVHQGLEARHVSFPVMVLPIGIANLVRRRQLWEMDVAGAVEALEKPGQVVLLGESRELPAGFEADVDDLLHPMLGKESEETLGRLLGETDGVQLHSSNPAKASCGGGTSAGSVSSGPMISSVPSLRMWTTLASRSRSEFSMR